MEEKRCSKCPESKEISEFYYYYSKQKGKYIYASRCKNCLREYSKEKSRLNYKIDAESVKKRNSQYLVENPEKRKKYRRESMKRYRENTGSSYVKSILNKKNGFTHEDLNNAPEIIENKRLMIKINRRIKSIRNGKKQIN